jgi:hypothetical protein
VAARRAGGDGGAGRAEKLRKAESTVEFAFGAVFTPLLSIPLQADTGERLTVSDLLPSASGRFWVADAKAGMLRVYSPEGRQFGTLSRSKTGLRRPVSLASLHGRWIAVLDGHLPAIAILDEAGRVVRRFPLPELDRPLQVCNLGDRRLAVVGTGWQKSDGRLVHLYTTDGEYIESLFGQPRDDEAAGRAFVAAAGSAMYLGHNRTDSFSIYDIEARAVVAFANQNSVVQESREGYGGADVRLCGLFAASCGPLIAQFALDSDDEGYLYDLYSLDGTPIALGLHSPERVVGVEGPLFYSVRTSRRGDNELRVWKLIFQEG